MINETTSCAPNSGVFDPSLLLGNQTLDELGPFLFVVLDPFVQEHLADLFYGFDPFEYKKTCRCHL